MSSRRSLSGAGTRRDEEHAAKLAAVTAERDAQIRDFQILHAERNALAEGFAEAKHDRATLLEAIEPIDAVSDPGSWVDANDAALSTASKIRERFGA